MLLFLLIAASTLGSEDLTSIGTGVLIAGHKFPFVFGALACAFGIFAGDLLLVWGGRLARLRTPAALDVLRTKPFRALLTSRFTPGLRLPVYVGAGLMRVPMRIVVPALVLGALVWTPLLVGAAALIDGAVLLSGLRILQSVILVVAIAVTAVRGRWFRWENRRRLAGRLKRIVRWEFWPAWAVYAPVIPYLMYLAFRYRSLTVFALANPGIRTGGLVGESKSEILEHLRREQDLVARHELLPGRLLPAARAGRLRAFIERESVEYPVVLKPDTGERGSGVAIIRSEADGLAYLDAAESDVIAQEYVPGVEFGVYYQRYPHEGRGRVLSITRKVLPELVGDGRRSLEQLILADSRAVCMYSAYRESSRHGLSYVPACGERVPLVEVGSHCRGAVFLNASNLLTSALDGAVERVSRTHPGFYLGRYDVRAESVEALQAGRFKVLELNGVGAEPAHIYDPAVSWLDAYRELYRHWRTAFLIGDALRAYGFSSPSVGELWAACARRKDAPVRHAPRTEAGYHAG
jgi:membrane protein DedA with SNARE-associated domain